MMPKDNTMLIKIDSYTIPVDNILYWRDTSYDNGTRVLRIRVKPLDAGANTITIYCPPEDIAQFERNWQAARRELIRTENELSN
jgi:hypothetical protein